MGTRADFYVGRGESAEWIGSIAFDGYPDGIADAVLHATSEAGYREAVAAFVAGRDDATLPADGWPWPWEDSCTTDYAYAFDAGNVWGSCFGSPWFDTREPEPEDEIVGAAAVFPQFTKDRNPPIGSKRSGIGLLMVPAPAEAPHA